MGARGVGERKFPNSTASFCVCHVCSQWFRGKSRQGSPCEASPASARLPQLPGEVPSGPARDGALASLSQPSTFLRDYPRAPLLPLEPRVSRPALTLILWRCRLRLTFTRRIHGFLLGSASSMRSRWGHVLTVMPLHRCGHCGDRRLLHLASDSPCT